MSATAVPAPLWLPERFEAQAKLSGHEKNPVWQVIDHTSGKLVAVKAFHDGLGHAEAVSEAFLKEVFWLNLVDSPRVVKLFDWLDQRPAMIVMEYAEGLPLSKWTDIPPFLCRDIGLELATALVAVHRAGLVHCDIKPQNLIVGPKGLKLIDFGIATPMRNLLWRVGMRRPAREHFGRDWSLSYFRRAPASSKRIQGTLGYVAPEQIKGLRPDQRVDIYGGGIVIYQMLTGEKLFTAKNIDEMNDQHRYADERIADQQFSPSWTIFLRRCLALSPSDRFQTVTEFKSALEGVMD